MGGDTLEQIAGADSHGVDVDKVNRDGSLKAPLAV
jgi:hypothetical protein